MSESAAQTSAAPMSEPVYVGIKQHVIALDSATGVELWKTKLATASTLVTVLVRGPYVFAASYGNVYGLDRYNGAIVWHNELPGMGYGFVTLAAAGAEGSIESAVTQAISEKQSG